MQEGVTVLVLSTVSASLLAHSIHYTLVAGGLVGLLVLLSPRLGERVLGQRATASPRAHNDEQRRRLLALQATLVGAGAAIGPGGRPTGLVPPPTEAPSAPARVEPSRLLVPLALVGSSAAAVVHAAVCQDHFEEGLLLGTFFAVATAAHLVWVGLVVRRPAAWLLAAGVAGNLGILALWAATRTAGLPWGLLPDGPEAVGPWDLTAGLLELVTALACLQALRRHRPEAAHWSTWHPAVRCWLGLAAAMVAYLLLLGAPA